MDVGSGPGVLIPHLQATPSPCILLSLLSTYQRTLLLLLLHDIVLDALSFPMVIAICDERSNAYTQRCGIRDILAVDVTPAMVEAVQHNFPSQSQTAGNEPQVRTWLGDVQTIPAYQVRSVLHLLLCNQTLKVAVSVPAWAGAVMHVGHQYFTCVAYLLLRLSFSIAAC